MQKQEAHILSRMEKKGVWDNGIYLEAHILGRTIMSLGLAWGNIVRFYLKENKTGKGN